jgi:hypothetical protein
MKKHGKAPKMPMAMPPPDAGLGGDAPMPGATPMSTPTPPGLPAGPAAGVPMAPSGPKHNPDNMLPAAAFHKR